LFGAMLIPAKTWTKLINSFRRFGAGIYTSSTSSKYVQISFRDRPYHMILTMLAPQVGRLLREPLHVQPQGDPPQQGRRRQRLQDDAE
jgi:hypothetical protein